MIVSVLGLCLFSSSCGPKVSFVPMHEEQRKWDSYVRILFEKPKDEAYIELGVLVGQGKRRNDWSDVLKALQKEAKQRGANAIVLVGANQNKKPGEGSVRSMGLYPRKTILATAIRILN